MNSVHTILTPYLSRGDMLKLCLINREFNEMAKEMLIRKCTDDEEMFKKVFTRYANQFNYYELFKDLCVSGNIEMCQYLISVSKELVELSDSQIAKIFIKVCKAGMINMAQWLLNTYPNIPIIQTAYGGLFGFYLEDFCERGQFDILMWLCNKDQQILVEIKEYTDYYKHNYVYDEDPVFYAACKGANIKILEWLYKLYDNKKHLIPVLKSNAVITCKNGKHDVLVWILEKLKRVKKRQYQYILEECYNKAQKYNHIHIAKWICNNGGKKN